jgi:hypothetical protein
MVFHMSFSVSWIFLLLSCHTYGLKKVKSIMLRKKPKKLYFTVFFDHLRAGRLTGFDTGLPVVSIRNTNRYTGFLLLKFKI